MCGYRNWQEWLTDKRFENSYECDGGVSCPGSSNPTISTSPPQRCHKDGPNEVGHCLDEFICCEYTGNNSWKETQCRCLNDFVFLEVSMCNKLNYSRFQCLKFTGFWDLLLGGNVWLQKMARLGEGSETWYRV